MTEPTQLAQTRKTLRYSQGAVITMLIRLGEKYDVALMSPASLKTKLSKWENGREPVAAAYRRLFREIYGRSNEDLGFPPEPEDDELEDLRSRIRIARSVDEAAVEIFRQQIDQARHVDRRFGGVTVLDQLRANIAQIRDLLTYSTQAGQRAALSAVLAEASALAGWEALDRNAIKQAWDHHEAAKLAAREANSPILLAHSTAQQAFILIDIGETDAAVDQLAHARAIADNAAPSLLQAWLAAAHGEGLAATGQRGQALTAFDKASDLLPHDPVDGALPYLFLGGAHLDRWRGHAMSRLGDTEAIDHLSDVLPRLPADFVRARAVTHVDLAFAHAASGDREAARTYARQAKQLAKQIKSDRQLSRLDRLILPTSERHAP